MISVDLQHAAHYVMAPLELFTKVVAAGKLLKMTLQLQP